MKNLITKFTSILLAVIISVSVLVVPLSASAYTYPDDYIHEFEPLTLAQKSLFFQNDVFMYNYSIVVYSPKNDKYNFYFLDKKDNPVSSFSYCDLGYHQNYLAFYNSTGQLVKLNYSDVLFNSDGSYYSSSAPSVAASYIGLGYDLLGCSLDDYDQYVIYSDFPIKYRGNTIYNPTQNREIQIKDFYTWNKGGIPSGADGDVAYGPLPLVPVSVDDESIQGFINWLVENEKYKDLASYGISVNANQVNQLVSIWCSNQGNLQKMYETWKLNISGVSVITKATQLKNWLTTQYDLYKKSLVIYAPQKLPDSVLDDSSDYDEDGNFISSYTAYLKLILGTLQSFFNSFNSFVDYISSYVAAISNNIYSIANDISVIPGQTAGYIYNNFVDPIDNIIAAINSIEVSGGNTTINNNYGSENKDDYSDTLASYVPKYQAAISAKVPALAQCEELFDSIIKSMNSSTGVSHYNLNGSVSENSVDSIIISGFSSAFPAFDSSYVYSSDDSGAPAVTVNVCGSDVNLIDFRIFARWQGLIHSVISLFAWCAFALSVYKSIPSLIAGVSGLTDVYLSADSNSILSPSDFEAEAILEAQQNGTYDDF